MTKQRTTKFWIFFWLLSAIFLIGFYFFLEFRNHRLHSILGLAKPVIKMVPLKPAEKNDILSVLDIIADLSNKKESTFLLLFQNNNELRPGGGYIGSFGILKIKEGKVSFVDSHDATVFDSRVSSHIKPPEPLLKYLGVKHWELRDSNWSPDFPTNAKKAIYFYHLEGGKERFDGVVAISAKLLPSFLEITGPLQIEGYPGVYTSENAIAKLEKQVEADYRQQGIEKGKRKYIMKKMAKVIVAKVQSASWENKKKLIKKIEQHLREKDILLYFQDKKLENEVSRLGWAGNVRQVPDADFLMMVDANLGAKKSDALMERKFAYSVDFRKQKPVAKLKITYIHHGMVRDLLTEDYRTYLRVFAPAGSWLFDVNGIPSVKLVDFSQELGRKVFGIFQKVNLGKSKTIEFDYYLPKKFTFDDYQLFIQKQAGVDKLVGEVTLISPQGKKQSYQINSPLDVLVSNKSYSSKKKKKVKEELYKQSVNLINQSTQRK